MDTLLRVMPAAIVASGTIAYVAYVQLKKSEEVNDNKKVTFWKWVSRIAVIAAIVSILGWVLPIVEIGTHFPPPI